MSGSLSGWLESLVSRSDGISERWYGEEEYKNETRDLKIDHFGKRGVQGRAGRLYPYDN